MSCRGSLLVVLRDEARGDEIRRDVVWRNEVRRDEAIRVTADFQQEIGRCHGLTEVERLVAGALDRLCLVQGEARAALHLATSLCRLSCALRRHDWPRQGRAVLEWGLARGVRDALIFNELARCYTAADDLVNAERTLDLARRHALLGPAIFATLISAYARRGQLHAAQMLFDAARDQGHVNSQAFSALLQAYGAQRNIDRARDLFAQATIAGLVDAHVYTALVQAHVTCGELDAAKRMVTAPGTARLLNEHGYLALMRGYLQTGDLRGARYVHLCARDRGCDAPRLYYILATAHQRAGRSVDLFRSLRKYARRTRARREQAVQASAQRGARGGAKAGVSRSS